MGAPFVICAVVWVKEKSPRQMRVSKVFMEVLEHYMGNSARPRRFYSAATPCVRQCTIKVFEYFS